MFHISFGLAHYVVRLSCAEIAIVDPYLEPIIGAGKGYIITRRHFQSPLEDYYDRVDCSDRKEQRFSWHEVDTNALSLVT
jgi:hypothetical protein